MHLFLSTLIILIVGLLAPSGAVRAEERDIPPAIQEDLHKLNSILELSGSLPDDDLFSDSGKIILAGNSAGQDSEQEAARQRRSRTEPVI